jgi:hypothetical protein
MTFKVYSNRNGHTRINLGTVEASDASKAVAIVRSRSAVNMRDNHIYAVRS